MDRPEVSAMTICAKFKVTKSVNLRPLAILLGFALSTVIVAANDDSMLAPHSSHGSDAEDSKTTTTVFYGDNPYGEDDSSLVVPGLTHAETGIHISRFKDTFDNTGMDLGFTRTPSSNKIAEREIDGYENADTVAKTLDEMMRLDKELEYLAKTLGIEVKSADAVSKQLGPDFGLSQRESTSKESPHRDSLMRSQRSSSAVLISNEETKREHVEQHRQVPADIDNLISSDDFDECENCYGLKADQSFNLKSKHFGEDDLPHDDDDRRGYDGTMERMFSGQTSSTEDEYLSKAKHSTKAGFAVAKRFRYLSDVSEWRLRMSRDYIAHLKRVEKLKIMLQYLMETQTVKPMKMKRKRFLGGIIQGFAIGKRYDGVSPAASIADTTLDQRIDLLTEVQPAARKRLWNGWLRSYKFGKRANDGTDMEVNHPEKRLWGGWLRQFKFGKRFSQPVMTRPQDDNLVRYKAPESVSPARLRSLVSQNHPPSVEGGNVWDGEDIAKLLTLNNILYEKLNALKSETPRFILFT